MGVGNRRMRRRLVLLALGGLGYYLYSAGSLDPFLNVHRCASNEFYWVERGACTLCSTCRADEEVISACHGTSDTKCRLSGFHDTSETQVQSELHGGTVFPPTSMPPHQQAKIIKDTAARAKTRSSTPPAPPQAATPSSAKPAPLSFPPAPPTSGSETDTSWKPVFGRTTTGPLIPYTREWIEDGWGTDCYSDKNKDILIALPYSPKMVSDTQECSVAESSQRDIAHFGKTCCGV